MRPQSLGSETKLTPESRRDFTLNTQKRLAALEIDRQNRLGLSDGAAQSRLPLLKSSVEAFIQNPILGISNWMVNGGQYPHNLLLESFQNLGIVGGAVFVALLVAGSYRAWRRIRIGHYLVPMLFFQALVAGQFSGSLYAHAQLWGTLALLLGASSSLFAKNLDAS
jgi:O-antigen ligase